MYVNDLENRLRNTLSQVDGAGKVSVVITVESGMETVLATETVINETTMGKETIKKPIIVNGKTVVVKEMYPKIIGVLIVAEGAGNIGVMTRIQKATTSLLDIEITPISVSASFAIMVADLIVPSVNSQSTATPPSITWLLVII